MKDDKTGIEVCDVYCLHNESLEKAEKSKPTEEMINDLSNLFKVLGNPTRIKIMYALFESEMCVCDIAVLLGMTQSAISHQLKVLKNSRLVKNRKEGKTVFYSLDDEHINHIFDCGKPR